MAGLGEQRHGVAVGNELTLETEHICPVDGMAGGSSFSMLFSWTSGHGLLFYEVAKATAIESQKPSCTGDRHATNYNS